MAFYFSKRKLKPREEEEAGELNIVPYLDILMNLIIFMLLSMTGLAAFGILNVSAPSYADEGGGGNEPPPALVLSVLIAKNGFVVGGVDGLPGGSSPSGEMIPTVPLKAGAYDYLALTRTLDGVKQKFPKESKVLLGASPTVPYDVLISTMDAVRENEARKLLFPDVTLAAALSGG